MTQAAGRPKVLSVVGPGRSGTTVLASILGEVDGVVTAGEVRWLWRRGVIEERPCGCGRPPAGCPVWSRVLADVIGAGPYRLDDEVVPAVLEMVRAQQEVSERRHRLRVIRSASGGDAGWPALRRVRAVTAHLCASLAATTGSSVIVDTSKRAQDAAVLAAVGSIDHYVLHVVRDPRAVAWSWRRAKPLRTADGPQTMATRRLVPSVVRWMENCIGAELLRRRVPRDRWLFMRYEDFAADPRGAVDAVLAFVGVDGAGTAFSGADTVVLGTNHTVAGNPNRFRTGPVRIVSDDEWRREMSLRDRRTVEAVAMPLLSRYGYPVLSRRASE